MLVYNYYETDIRVLRYAEALADRGDRVDVFALGRPGQPSREVWRGVNLYRIQACAIKPSKKIPYLFKLLSFLFLSAILVTVHHLRRPYSLIHVHSVPDFEVFAATFAKLTGAKIILDIHDIVPELYANKFNTSQDGMIFKMLVLTEKICAAFSDHVIISNHIWEKTLIARSVPKEKCTTILNYVDRSIFFPRPRTRKDDRFVVIYPGSINWHQGLDIAIRAVALIAERGVRAELHIYGEGGASESLSELITRLGVADRVFIRGSIPIEEVAGAMADADLGIVPKRDDSFGGEAFSTKILEFMSLGVPVIVSSTKIDRYYFNDQVVKFFPAEDVEALADALLLFINDRELRESQAQRALSFVEQYAWDKQKGVYLALVDTLIGSTHGN